MTLTDRFEILKRGFLERCREQILTLEALVQCHDPTAQGTDRAMLEKTAHSLAGAGGTFGFPEISDRAFRLEEVMIEDGARTEAVRAALESLITELKRITG